MVGNMQIFPYLKPYLFRIVHIFWTARESIGGVSFHGLLRSETEFWPHLPFVLRIHTLPSRMYIWRTAGRCCRNFVSDRSTAWKLTLSTDPRMGLGPILTYQIVGTSCRCNWCLYYSPLYMLEDGGPLKGPCLVLVIEWQLRWTNCVYVRYIGD